MSMKEGRDKVARVIFILYSALFVNILEVIVIENCDLYSSLSPVFHLTSDYVPCMGFVSYCVCCLF